MIDKIFICTSNDQALAAKVSKHSFEKHLIGNIDVEIIHNEKIPYLEAIFEKNYKRNNNIEVFNKDDMQSFTLARFYVPELMNYDGIALVIDPDIFLVNEARFLEHKSLNYDDFDIFCRKNINGNSWASSAMILNCKKLKHWDLKNIIESLIEFNSDYYELINLINESANIFELTKSWNDFDNFNESSILLHLTQKDTQPWRVGLKLESYIPPIMGFLPRAPIYKLLGRDLTIGRNHPNKEITKLFLSLFSECVSRNIISHDDINKNIDIGYLRTDIYELIQN